MFTIELSPGVYVGEVPGVAIGSTFADRRSLHDAGVHRGACKIRELRCYKSGDISKMDNLKVKLRRLRLWRGVMRVRRLLARGDYDGARAIARTSHQDELAERRYLCERILELGGEIPRTFPETQMRNMRRLLVEQLEKTTSD